MKAADPISPDREPWLHLRRAPQRCIGAGAAAIGSQEPCEAQPRSLGASKTSQNMRFRWLSWRFRRGLGVISVARHGESRGRAAGAWRMRRPGASCPWSAWPPWALWPWGGCPCEARGATTWRGCPAAMAWGAKHRSQENEDMDMPRGAETVMTAEEQERGMTGDGLELQRCLPKWP